MPADESLDELIRRVDPDRWLSSRFVVDPQARADLMVIYAFDHELQRARHVASNTLVAEIRLVWWREALDEIFGDHTLRETPLVRSLAEVISRRSLPAEPFGGMISARIDSLDHSLLTPDLALSWSQEVAGGAAMLAALILDPQSDRQAARVAMVAWGLTRLYRAGLLADMDYAKLVLPARRAASNAARQFKPAAFPAIAHAALARPTAMSPLRTRLRVLWSVATGRI